MPISEHRSETSPLSEGPPRSLDFSDVRGQETAKRAAAIAVVGQHNLLLSGPPGCGKSMIAERMCGLLEPLSRAEALEVNILRGLDLRRGKGDSSLLAPPYRAPHHSATQAAMVGGGNPIRPGEASLAHRGLLFLDELPEFNRTVLETLRQPLETGALHLSRVHQRVDLPADFLLVGAMNPCPCGYFGTLGGLCECAEEQVRRYQSKLSGPLLDRIDLFVPLQRVGFDDVLGEASGLGTRELMEQIKVAREFRRKRLGSQSRKDNRRVVESPEKLSMSAAAESLARRAMEKRNWSARSVAKCIRVARTIADFAEHDEIEVPDIAEAMAFRHRSFRENARPIARESL